MPEFRIKDHRNQKLYKGTIATADSRGFRRLPWHRAYSNRAEAGELASGEGIAAPEKPAKSTAQQKAEDLAKRFVDHLEAMRTVLGRPVTPADLSDEFCAAFGLDLWKEMGHRLDEPVPGIEFFRRVAGVYLEGIEKGAKKDPRWTPSGRGYVRPEAEQARSA